jgi:aspartyl-tRNA(Asn)/glutamyl-tRNA(Gln) amidotransferase subunit C
MAIDPAIVEHVAELARLALTDDEKIRFAGQLARIVEHYQALRAVARDAGPLEAAPVSATRAANVLRDDIVTPSLPRGDVLEAAPAHDGAFFVVPPIFETD